MVTWSEVRSRLPQVNPVILDWVVAAALFAQMAAAIAHTPPVHGERPADLGAYLLSVGLTVPFSFHRRFPMAAIATNLSCLLAYGLLQFAAFPGLSLFVLLFGIALHTDRVRALIALAAALIVLPVVLLAQPSGVVTTSTWTSVLLAAAVAWLTGENWRNRRARWSAMEARTARLEQEREERARQAVTEERLRIARELHDIVAHSMSVIAVQSGVGHHVIDTDVDAARRALAAIETTSREALTEMRRLLGVLRQDEEQADKLAPAPRLADVYGILEQLRDSGLDVTMEIEGGDRELSPAVDLCAYRIIQEALTNVIKHGGRAAHVTVACREREVDIEVTDEGSGHMAPVGGPSPSSVNAGAGHGLVGMRERVALFGGAFSAGRRPGGGFRVSAQLPYGGPQG